MTMMVLLLGIAVLIAAAGLGAVIWAARGGPRWVRGVAKATTVAAEIAASAAKSGGRRGSGSNSADA
ncbi:hypothetical protein AB0I16_26460 [Streptomyces sp. NPDC050703]|uniref:hypothetical protein n=1 Tax=Streptomyces sp. NPDC050703 TaxID=3157218 RepID=UPI0034472227